MITPFVGPASNNGKSHRLVILKRADGSEYRDHLDTDSGFQRQSLLERAALQFDLSPEELTHLDPLIVKAADEEDQRADGKKHTTARGVAPFRPMPLEVFAAPVASFIRTAARAIGCDESTVAIPAIVALAASIGNARQVRIKHGWVEPSVIWAVQVAESGMHKTPAQRAVWAPFYRWQENAVRDHQKALAEYQEQLQNHQRATKGKHKNEWTATAKPEAPACVRYTVSDCTLEALASILDANPRGVPLVADELNSWLRSFGQYKGGRGGDVGHWLAMHSAGYLTVDRKTGDRKTICVARANVSICGGIQPDTLRAALKGEHFDNGLAARLLFAMPPRTPRGWTEQEIPESAYRDLEEVYSQLLSLDFATNDAGICRPIEVPLTPDAKSLFVEFVNRHGQEQAALAGALASAWSKLEGYGARLSLVLHFARYASDPTGVDTSAVDAQSVEAGLRLVEWFKAEARRVYVTLQANDEERERQHFAEIIRRQEKPVTARDLAKATRLVADADEAESVLNDLAKAGYGHWETQAPGDKGGRPTSRFVLDSPVDETPLNHRENDSFGYADGYRESVSQNGSERVRESKK
jgi:hypothetical protein